MIGVLCSVIIVLVAIDAIGREPGIGAIGMALGTILDVVALGQREKVMVDIGRSPPRIGGMAIVRNPWKSHWFGDWGLVFRHNRFGGK